jgi:hypothetical protein
VAVAAASRRRHALLSAELLPMQMQPDMLEADSDGL